MVVVAAVASALLGWMVAWALTVYRSLVVAFLVGSARWLYTDGWPLLVATPLAVFALVEGPAVWRWLRGHRRP